MTRALARVDTVMLEARAAVLVKRAIEGAAKRCGIDLALACLDLTTLEGRDSPGSVRALCARARLPAPGAPHAAAVCIYSKLVPVAVEALAGSGVKVAAVATAFPSGLVPLAVKLAETRAAIAAGADEIDMVVDRGALLAGREREAANEIVAVREACGGRTLKVILEAGELGSYAAVRRTCDLVLASGADFLKTATGKLAAGATPALVLLFCEAIADYYRVTGRPVGLKVAGGVRTVKSALGYLALVKETLGDAWLDPARFRIGASTLLDDLLAEREPRG